VPPSVLVELIMTALTCPGACHRQFRAGAAALPCREGSSANPRLCSPAPTPREQRVGGFQRSDCHRRLHRAAPGALRQHRVAQVLAMRALHAGTLGPSEGKGNGLCADGWDCRDTASRDPGRDCVAAAQNESSSIGAFATIHHNAPASATTSSAASQVRDE
jgi:hypothetical protein